nr:hypothetical protein [uncultured Caproiciproducens sp.]
MKVKMKLVSLTLIGSRKNYTVPFRDGFNYISGHTSTGKTSILEMIDYALGSKGHKSYIEIGNSCSQVELVLYIGDEKYKIRRQLFDFKAAVIVDDWNEEKQKFLFYNRFGIDTPSNPKSLSAFLIEKLGLANMTISGQTFSFRDLYKYCYIKQTEIDNEDILGEKSWEKDFKRKATFEIIFNIYDKTLEEFKTNLEARREEAKELTIKLTGIRDFLQSIDIADLQECTRKESKLHQEIVALQQQLSTIKKDKGVDSVASMALRKEIEQIKNALEKVAEEKEDQKQYLNKLRLLYNQYTSEIEKKELAIEGYMAFNQYEFLFCPNCLKPISRPDSVEVCCLCGSERSDDKGELVLLKKDIAITRRKSNELLKFTEIEDRKYDGMLREEVNLKAKLHEEELELQHLSKDYINPNMEQIEYINYEIGKKNSLIFEFQKDLKMFEEVERYQQLIKDKDATIQIIKSNIKALSENSVDKQDLINRLSQTFEGILESFEYPKLSTAYIDEKRYLPYVRGQRYDDLGSLAGVTLITMAYYLAIMLVGSSSEFCHPNLLIMDSPRKNLGAQAAKNEAEEFKDEKIFHAIIKYLYETAESMKDDIQLIVVNNGYPDFLPHECIVAEFDSDARDGLPRGLIDDAIG